MLTEMADNELGGESFEQTERGGRGLRGRPVRALSGQNEEREGDEWTGLRTDRASRTRKEEGGSDLSLELRRMRVEDKDEAS
ncbi:hypothetical protein Sjap_016983 [Stephania japonica]|uniref:Uncharacterized protein n=1 Tax=Stephania japonica TaxID=461633 RepID=A0AAP0NIV6_9MAGN